MGILDGMFVGNRWFEPFRTPVSFGIAIGIAWASSVVHSGAQGPVWEARAGWSAQAETDYAAFVGALFAGEEDNESWPNLHSLLRDPARNRLHNTLGRDEEDRLILRPDCGDLPYVLRAYFAWKNGLPFRFLRCSRGSAPECRSGDDQRTGATRSSGITAAGSVAAFQAFMNHRVMTSVHSGSGRTQGADEMSDFYPIGLSRDAIRAGTIYVDPYGHSLVVVGFSPQPESGAGYLMLADAQPDGTIGRRKMWRGSPLFNPDPEYGGSGFKAFRPLDLEGRAWPNDALISSSPFSAWSDEQARLSARAFHDRLEELASPRALDTRAALMNLLDRLEAQLERRVASVARGEAFARRRRSPIVMPEGDIFAASGDWEAYATPVRDWRLLIAFDVVRDFPDRVQRGGDRFLAGANEVQTLLDSELARRRVVYEASDGQSVERSIAELMGAAGFLEMGYNPNDCVEIRWGAEPGDACHRRAPKEQTMRMDGWRRFFRQRTRPSW